MLGCWLGFGAAANLKVMHKLARESWASFSPLSRVAFEVLIGITSHNHIFTISLFMLPRNDEQFVAAAGMTSNVH